MAIHIRPAALLSLGFLFAISRAAADEPYIVKPYVVGGSAQDAQNSDRVMAGIQHWYADQFGGRTFKFAPTQVVESMKNIPGNPGGNGIYDIAEPRKGVLNVVWNAYYNPGKAAGQGAATVGNGRDLAGEAMISLRGVLDPIINGSTTKNRNGYGTEEQAWYVVAHEVGHALGMEHVGDRNDVMQAPMDDLSPYDTSKSRKEMGDVMKRTLSNSNFLNTANNPGYSDQQVKEIVHPGSTGLSPTSPTLPGSSQSPVDPRRPSSPSSADSSRQDPPAATPVGPPPAPSPFDPMGHKKPPKVSPSRVLSEQTYRTTHGYSSGSSQAASDPLSHKKPPKVSPSKTKAR